MRQTFPVLASLLLLLGFTNCSTAQKTHKAKQYAVHGTITQTRSYCGGARPSDEMLEKLNTPRPLPGIKLYVRSGNTNQLKKRIQRTIVADSAGNFVIHLPPGTYCIIQEEQIKKLNPESYRKKQTEYLKLDENCLNKWWSDCLLTFEVKAEDKKGLNINFNTPCFTNGVPCLNYTGPMPP
jgi:hypothetical protein